MSNTPECAKRGECRFVITTIVKVMLTIAAGLSIQFPFTNRSYREAKVLIFDLFGGGGRVGCGLIMGVQNVRQLQVDQGGRSLGVIFDLCAVEFVVWSTE